MFPEKPVDPLTEKQWKRYEKASRCHICSKSFNSKDPKVRDHCHYTGRYRAPAQSLCNLRYRISSYIPVVFYNLLSYDARLFSKELGKHSNDIGVIAKNKEDYITFSVDVEVNKYIDKNGEEKDKKIELQFIDSFKFMSSILDSLTDNLVHGDIKNCSASMITTNLNIIYLPEKEFTPMSICRAGVASRNPNFLL